MQEVGAAQAGQFLLCIPVAAASWKMLSQTVGHIFVFILHLSHQQSLISRSLLIILFITYRGPCGDFSERRAQKAAQAADVRAKGGQPVVDDSLTDDDASAEDELDSDEGPVDGPESSRVEERCKMKAMPPTEPRLPPFSAKKHRTVDGTDNRLAPPWPSASDATTSGASSLRKIQPARAMRPKIKYEADYVASAESGMSASRLPRRLILNLADLDSIHGRYVRLAQSFPSFLLLFFLWPVIVFNGIDDHLPFFPFTFYSINFIFSSIAYLFMATYESTDDMTISSLLTYLNAAMPPDKHEDFDTAEVAKAVAALSDKGDIIFEGDTLRLPG